MNIAKTLNVDTIQFSLESPGIHLDDKLHNNLITRVEKLGKFYSNVTKCEMILRVEKNDKNNNCLAEAKIFIPGKMFFTQQKGPDFYKAVDILFDDLGDQIVRHKEKLQA